MIKEHDTYDYNTVFTQKDAEVYAKLTDDYNPIHIDREYATATEFGRPVAQGVLILCAFDYRGPHLLQGAFLSSGYLTGLLLLI